MSIVIEVKYLAIRWKDENTPLKITESLQPLIVEEDNNAYRVELHAYKRISGLDAQVAFRILDESSNIEPYFTDASNNKHGLLKIVDPFTDKSWWIENGKWKGKYREAPLWNHVGSAKVVFGTMICHLDIRANSFTKEQLNEYLSDFQNDFWYLIFKPNSLTKGAAKNQEVKLLNDESIDVLKKFITYASSVLKTPKKELKEIQSVKDLKKVKPVIKTFMEIAISGIRRKHTSRDTVESYDVAENRYVHYALQRVYIILFYIQNASIHMEDFYKKGYEFHNKRLSTFSNTVTINRNILENEMDNLRKKIETEKVSIQEVINKQDVDLLVNLEATVSQNSNVSKLITQGIQKQNRYISSQNNFNCFIVKLENRQNDYGNKIQFWGKIKGCGTESWDDFGVNNWLSLGFDIECFGFLETGQTYKLVGENSYRTSDTPKGTIHNISFTYIDSMNLIENDNDDLATNKLSTVVIQTKGMKEFNDLLQFSGEIQDVNGKWITLPDQNDFYSFEFNKDMFGHIIKSYQTYEITAYIDTMEQPWAKGVIHKLFFKYITNIELINSSYTNELNSLEKQIPNLEAKNWKRELSDKEKQEQDKERRALEESIKQLESHQKESSKLSKDLLPLMANIKNLLTKCKDLKIKQSSFFPNSMTFVQNPDYQGTYKFYNKIKDLSGIDKSLFIQLQIIENIGLVEIPTLYERWCLLQIIKVLIDQYNYLPEENWKLKLSSHMIEDISKIRDIEIIFLNQDTEKEITLKYEHTLKNKKRPDYILDIKSLSTDHVHRLVMDAKFHEDVDIEKQIRELYFRKDYAEDYNNTVFILHPDFKAIKNQRTPTKWGDNSFYGETDLCPCSEDKDEYPNHKYGAILLSPFNKEGNFLDNLQRVIGLSLQYNMEDNASIVGDDKSINPIPEEKIFCLVCGSANCKVSKPKPASKYPNRWFYEVECQEQNCQHFFIYNYCWNCKYRLIKNGRYWTYHSLQLMNEFDVRCPHCNKLLSEMPKGDMR